LALLGFASLLAAVGNKVVKILNKAVFLDRDGVINRSIVRGGKPYAPKSFLEIEILPGVKDALIKLRNLGYLNIVVTNQPDISTGLQTIESVDLIHQHLISDLAIDAFYVCPHLDVDFCQCRKPSPGLIIDAAEELRVDVSRSYLVGDRWRDIEAGQRAGCDACFFIDYRYKEKMPCSPFTAVSSLAVASRIISELTA
jgi:D-glycero-D-manno-heptose 1,7-bisphosphate phosphatase